MWLPSSLSLLNSRSRSLATPSLPLCLSLSRDNYWVWPRGHSQVVYAAVGGWHLGKPHRQIITFNLSKVADDWTSSTGIRMLWKWSYHSVLRCLKTELLQKRKNLPIEQKRRSYVKHLRQWPYMELHLPNSPTIRPETKVETIVQSVLGFCPSMSLADWSCHQSRLKYKHHVSPAIPQPNADFVTPSTFNPWLAAWMGPIQLNILMQLCAIY